MKLLSQIKFKNWTFNRKRKFEQKHNAPTAQLHSHGRSDGAACGGLDIFENGGFYQLFQNSRIFKQTYGHNDNPLA